MGKRRWTSRQKAKIKNCLGLNKPRNSKLIGQLCRERGATAEKRALEALLEDWEQPEWFGKVSMATPEEDSRGIDIVINTADIGKIFVQVKSSKIGKKLFEQRRRSSNILVVIIKPKYSIEAIRLKLLAAIKQERGRLLSLRIE